MFTMFSELLRNILMFIALILMKFSSGGFKYCHSYFNKDTNELVVKYFLNGRSLEESYEDFLRSPYFKFLTTKQLKKLINDISEEKSKNKYFKITTDENDSDLFFVKNTITNLSTQKLLPDIVSDKNILEHATAASIRELINGAARLASIEATEQYSQKHSDDGVIVPYPKK